MVGYKTSMIYAFCDVHTVPIYCKLFSGDIDKYSVIRETFEHFFSLGYELPSLVFADTRPYSIENLKYLLKTGILPLKNSKKSIKIHNTIKFNESH